MIMDLDFGVMKKGLAGALALFILGTGAAFSQENSGQQKASASIAPTMPVPKLPYNMPSTRVNGQRYEAEMDRSVANTRQQGALMVRAPAANGIVEPEKKRSEYLKWSQPENGLRVTVQEGEGRGKLGEGSQPVRSLLGARPGGTVSPAGMARPSQGMGPATASATPIAANPVLSTVPAAPVAPALPQYGPADLGGVGSLIPQPLPGDGGAIPQPDMFIRDAGGTPQRFESPPPPVLPAGIEVAPAIVPATPPAAAPVEKKRGFFGKIFGGKRPSNETKPVDTSNYITTGPEITAPVAPVSTATPADPTKKEFVVVKAETGTHFVIAGETTNGQSGILIPSGTVLQRLGLNGQWTTVRSPNGTTGSVQNVDIRDATFDEAIQFISSTQ